jgi:EAL domain-containing protein (putative c-di-GMP-specific phosphodiesterase class I)
VTPPATSAHVRATRPAERAFGTQDDAGAEPDSLLDVLAPRRGATRATSLVERIIAGSAAVTFAYQPIAEAATGRVCGYEVLARFPRARRLGPEPVFAMARREGRSAELEARVLATALARRPLLPDGVFLSLNISPAALVSPVVTSILLGAGDLDGIVLELTEHPAEPGDDALRAALTPLRAAGALVAVDDVGAGQSTLRRAAALDPDILKIDRTLVRDIHRDWARRILVEMLVDEARRLGARVVAEGVERAEELTTLRRLAIDLAQGWLMGRPRLRI